MELRRAADALLRSNASPLASFLAPAAHTRWTHSAIRTRSNIQAQRTFTSSTSDKALRPSATTSATSPTETSSSPSTTPRESTEKLGQSLWASRQRPPPPDFKFGLLSLEKQKLLNGGSSSSDIEAAFLRASPKSSINIANMDMPLSSTPFSSFDALSIPKPARIPMLLNPSTGRSVAVGGKNIDVGRAFRLLEMACARNRVRRDATTQRFHERGGLKRKRLRRERWQKRFLEGFKATVGRVKQLKNQGW